MVQKLRETQVGVNNIRIVLSLDEEVFGCTSKTRVFIAEGCHEHGGFTIVVKLLRHVSYSLKVMVHEAYVVEATHW